MIQKQMTILFTCMPCNTSSQIKWNHWKMNEEFHKITLFSLYGKNFGTISLHNSGNENGFILKCNKHLLGRSFSSFNCRPYNREDGIGQCNET